MNDLRHELPYPEHTPPAPPEGMKWEYRGIDWRAADDEIIFYAVKLNGMVTDLNRVRKVFGSWEYHYFEAVPILDAESGFIKVVDEGARRYSFPENPKESAGREKCPMQLLPPEFLIQTANVMGAGAAKHNTLIDDRPSKP